MSTQNISLNRTLTLSAVVLFGLAYMTPMIVFGTFGVLAETTNGLVPTAYIVGLSAMLFTAYSYGRMVKAFPASGSAYTYTRKAIGSRIGFMIGWTILLDYLFLPMVIWLIGAVYLNSAFPAVPIWTWILIFIAITTAINLIGINSTKNVNYILMLFQILVIGIFIVLSIVNVLHGMGTGTLLSFAPFYQADVPFSLVIAGAAIACYSFLGFDAVSTLSEETVEPEKTLPRAIFLITLIGGAIFVGSSFIIQLVQPNYEAFINADSAALEIAQQIGGNLFSAIFLAGLIIAQFTSGLSAQTSAARLIYAMGRDSVLPKKLFGFIHPKSRTPVINIMIIGIIGFLAIFLDITTSTSFINFGAFITFIFVNLSVIFHYYIKEKKRQGKDVLLYLILPLIGACLDMALFVNLDKNALILGSVWVALGFCYLLYITKAFSKATPQMEGQNDNIAV
ncbi:APC family permease [Aquibacillus albus]|uniref:Amino acid transporter n=1 Tax=Aquibacillus albus TaxID=1168171 RepID=A0ABS2MWM8_9BACI|nr:APC family permease [Aquibacillus albus]MBM7570105.1 amino acid transporter [Aquibacillus albus]